MLHKWRIQGFCYKVDKKERGWSSGRKRTRIPLTTHSADFRLAQGGANPAFECSEATGRVQTEKIDKNTISIQKLLIINAATSNWAFVSSTEIPEGVSGSGHSDIQMIFLLERPWELMINLKSLEAIIRIKTEASPPLSDLHQKQIRPMIIPLANPTAPHNCLCSQTHHPAPHVLENQWPQGNKNKSSQTTCSKIFIFYHKPNHCLALPFFLIGWF